MQRYAGDAEVVRYMAWGPNDAEDTRAFLEGAHFGATSEPRKSFQLAVILPGDDVLIGGVGLESRDDKCRDYEVGYCFAPEFWGGGYARDAVRGLTAFAFDELEASRVHARVVVENAASARLLEGLSFRIDEYLERDCQLDGEWYDSRVYITTPDDWR